MIPFFKQLELGDGAELQPETVQSWDQFRDVLRTGLLFHVHRAPTERLFTCVLNPSLVNSLVDHNAHRTHFPQFILFSLKNNVLILLIQTLS